MHSLWIIQSVWIWVIGAIIGSFLNVVIYRYSREGMNIFKPARSFCPSCERTLAWYENLPILSFILLRGKCKTCHKPISPRYLLVELFTPLLMWINLLALGFGWTWLGASLITISLIVVFVVDLQTSTISDWNWIVVGAGSAIIAWSTGMLVFNGIVAAVVLGLFLLIYWIYKGRFGMGDVLLIAAASFGLGMVGITLTILIASLSGLLYAAARRKKMKEAIPFGPFLAVGIYISLLVSDHLWMMMVYS